MSEVIKYQDVPEDAIVSFRGEHRFLSNFGFCSITLEGVELPSLEHAFVASKVNQEDVRCKAMEISNMTTSEAKRHGRRIPIRNDWNEIRVDVMRALIEQKFNFINMNGKKLMATKDRMLIEGNEWGDRYWGMERTDIGYEGHNNLGNLLMERRTELLKGN